MVIIPFRQAWDPTRSLALWSDPQSWPVRTIEVINIPILMERIVVRFTSLPQHLVSYENAAPLCHPLPIISRSSLLSCHRLPTLLLLL